MTANPAPRSRSQGVSIRRGKLLAKDLWRDAAVAHESVRDRRTRFEIYVPAMYVVPLYERFRVAGARLGLRGVGTYAPNSLRRRGQLLRASIGARQGRRFRHFRWLRPLRRQEPRDGVRRSVRRCSSGAARGLGSRRPSRLPRTRHAGDQSRWTMVAFVKREIESTVVGRPGCCRG